MIRRALAIVFAALLLGGCAGGSTEAPSSAAAIAADTNAGALQFTGELASTQMLDVRTGAVTALNEVATGDRAVLLWYWAPD